MSNFSSETKSRGWIVTIQEENMKKAEEKLQKATEELEAKKKQLEEAKAELDAYLAAQTEEAFTEEPEAEASTEETDPLA